MLKASQTYEGITFMVIAATNARKELFTLIEKLNQGDTPVLITSKAGNAYLIAESEYEGMLETLHLMASPKNYAILLKSIAEFEAGKGKVVEFPFTQKRSEPKKVAAARRVAPKHVSKKKISNSK